MTTGDVKRIAMVAVLPFAVGALAYCIAAFYDALFGVTGAMAIAAVAGGCGSILTVVLSTIYVADCWGEP